MKKPDQAIAAELEEGEPSPQKGGGSGEPGRFDARKTWGRVFGGIKLAAVLAVAADEFVEKAVTHKKAVKATVAAPPASRMFAKIVSRGMSFGDDVLLVRRPGMYFEGMSCMNEVTKI